MGRVRAHGTPVRRSLNRSWCSFEIQVVALYQMAQRASLTLLITHYSGSMLLGPTQPLTCTLDFAHGPERAPLDHVENGRMVWVILFGLWALHWALLHCPSLSSRAPCFQGPTQHLLCTQDFPQPRLG